MNKSVFIFASLTFSITSLVSMDLSKPSPFPSLKDFCFANIIDLPDNPDISILPWELAEEFIEAKKTIGSSVTETIENNIVRRAPDSFLLTLCLRNKGNTFAHKLMMQILNKFPQDLVKDFEQGVDDYNKEQIRINKDWFVDQFSQLVYLDAKAPKPFNHDSSSWYCAYNCINSGNEAAVRYLINKFKLDVNKLSFCPLRRVAADNNKFLLAKSLFDLGKNVDSEEIPPLIHAAHNGHYKMVALLLNYGSKESFDAITHMFAFRDELELNEPRKKILQKLCKKISQKEETDLINEINNVKQNDKIFKEWQAALQEAINSRDN